MKRYLYLIAATLLISVGCEDTNENLVQERGAAVVPIMSDPAPAYFSDNIEASYVQFDVSLSPGDQIDKAEIEIVRERGNKSGILKEISLPATGLKVTAAEILSALNIPVSDYNLGDVYYLYVLTTRGGQTTRSLAAFPIPVVCYFEPSMLIGNFHYVSDSWEEEGDVTFVADPDDPYKVYIEGYPESEGLPGIGKIELNLDPNNFKLSGPEVVIANDLSAWGVPAQDYIFRPVSGTYSACDNKYTVVFNISLSLWGNQGNYEFVFTKTN